VLLDFFSQGVVFIQLRSSQYEKEENMSYPEFWGSPDSIIIMEDLSKRIWG